MTAELTKPHLSAEEMAGVEAGESLLKSEAISLNVGPHHPSTHGVLRLVVDMEGEFVTRVEPHMGYLHTGFEKTMENRTYQQGVTYAPRTDYLHSFSHELAYVLSAEKLLGAEVPERASVVRVILHELGRMHSHTVFVGTGLLDLGLTGPNLRASGVPMDNRRDNPYCGYEQ